VEKSRKDGEQERASGQPQPGSMGKAQVGSQDDTGDKGKPNPEERHLVFQPQAQDDTSIG
jgi:hypothetical protein